MSQEAKKAWKLVQDGIASWDGGKPKGSVDPPKIGGKTGAEMVIEDRR